MQDDRVLYAQPQQYASNSNKKHWLVLIDNKTVNRPVPQGSKILQDSKILQGSIIPNFFLFITLDLRYIY